MRKQLLSISLLCSPVLFADDLFSDILNEMRALEERMEAHRKEMFKTMDEMVSVTKDSSKKAVSLNVSEDDQHVIALIGLPATELADKGITVQAKDNNLEGSLITKDGGNLSFYVKRGKLFELSYNLHVKKKIEPAKKEEAKEKEEKQQEEMYQTMSASSFERMLLPKAVTNLEQARVEYSNGTLKVMMPKVVATAAKTGWKKIDVKQAEQK